MHDSTVILSPPVTGAPFRVCCRSRRRSATGGEGRAGHACGDYCGCGFTVAAPRARVMLRAKAGVRPMPLQPQMEVHRPRSASIPEQGAAACPGRLRHYYARSDLAPSCRGTRRTARRLPSHGVCGWTFLEQDDGTSAQAAPLARELCHYPWQGASCGHMRTMSSTMHLKSSFQSLAAFMRTVHRAPARPVPSCEPSQNSCLALSCTSPWHSALSVSRKGGEKAGETIWILTQAQSTHRCE